MQFIFAVAAAAEEAARGEGVLFIAAAGVKVDNSTRYAMRYASNKGSLSGGQRMGDDSCS